MNLLNNILDRKRSEINARRRELPINDMIQFPLFNRVSYSLKNAISKGNGIIAEYKRASPSIGKIQSKPISEVIGAYQKSNVAACSVLTDHHFFEGKIDDLSHAREVMKTPLLRKEFIIDEYQIFEAKAYGADAILLIADILDEYHAKHLITIAHSIGLEALMEFHTRESLSKIDEAIDIIGINNRNLNTLDTDIKQSKEMFKYLPYKSVKITESGISKAQDLEELYALGYDGALIGHAILSRPGLLDDLIHKAEQLKTIRYAL